MKQRTNSLHESVSLWPILTACMGSILIGISPLFIRSSTLGPMVIGFYRMLFALPFLWIWMRWENSRVSLKDYMILSLAGGFFAFDLALWNWGVNHTTIVNATLFNNTAAFFVPLLMWLFFFEKQSLLASLSGFLGCVFLAVGGENFTISAHHLIGDLMSLASGLMVSAYVITIKEIRKRISTGTLMFWTGLTSLVGMGGFGLFLGESFGSLSQADWLSVFGQATLVHVIGQGLLAYAMGKIPASYGALILLLAPVTAAILGWVFYGETLNSLKIIGISIIMGSIVAAHKKRSQT